LPPGVAVVVVIASVLVPDPEMDVGLNEAVVPVGNPVVVKVTAELKPPLAATVTV
jgi:hypothetical protein